MKVASVFVAAVVFASISSPAFAAGDAKAGKVKFDMLCSSCHGPLGDGNGPAGGALNPKPANFTLPEFHKRDDATIAKAIREGGQAVGKSPLMPPWGHSLQAADIDNLVAYIRSLKK